MAMGIELINGLHNIAINNYNTGKLLHGANDNVRFINGSIFDTEITEEWVQADVVFVNSLCFSAEMMCSLNASAGTYDAVFYQII